MIARSKLQIEKLNRGRRLERTARHRSSASASARSSDGVDFLSDAVADGRFFRTPALVDDFTRECLVPAADTSLPGLRIVLELDTVMVICGHRALILSDNGTEFTIAADAALVAGEPGPSGITLRAASQLRTRLWRASTAASAPSC